MAYLYGVSVQGIQEYIFATNKLKDIVGASKLVEEVDKLIEEDRYTPDTLIMNAAGNIKAIYKDEAKLRYTVKHFLKEIKQKAYGITISQAVVKIDSEQPTQDAINKLEQKLKIQRNIPTIPLDMYINILKQSTKSARSAIKEDKKAKNVHEAYIDISTMQKRDRYDKDSENEKYKELSTLANAKRKIAIIHADGNGLGTLIPQLETKYNTKLKDFSKRLDFATKEAFKIAKEGKKIRHIILGGDDMVAICDADDALEFTKVFLEEFEKNTKSIIKDHDVSLTACAGIAYCHDKFPFHYGVALAEELCSQTKKHAKKINKDLAPSSLMFHNIQSSSFQSWEQFVEDELTINGEIRCDFGPYYLTQEKEAKIEDLLSLVELYHKQSSPKGRLRDWLSKLGKSSSYAKKFLEQIYRASLHKDGWCQKTADKKLGELYPELSGKKLIVQKDGELKTPIYDVLQILSATGSKS